VQRVQSNDSAGNLLPKSNLYIAVSQTGDPTALYNVYFVDTTDTTRIGCPCLADYPQIGADQYGVYISSNEYALDSGGNASPFSTGATILAISKASLAASASSPTAYKFVITATSKFEFAIQPASTPAGGSYALGGGGIEYFMSTISTGDSNLSVWAMSNTCGLTTGPGACGQVPALMRIVIPTLPYSIPPNAVQKPGPLPYGSTLIPPGLEAFIDSSDCRMLTVEYVGARLYASWVTVSTDTNGHFLAAAAYAIISPVSRGGGLTATTLAAGSLLVNNNHLLRPAIAVNPSGVGAIGFTLVGPDYFPSAAFVTIDAHLLALGTLSIGSAVELAASGSAPEDGFTGYPDIGIVRQGTARWGDYSTAVASADGSVWMVSEYIPNAPRTQFANWGTFLSQVPAVLGH